MSRIPTIWYLILDPCALNTNVKASQWDIGCVGSPHIGARMAMLISGCLCQIRLNGQPMLICFLVEYGLKSMTKHRAIVQLDNIIIAGS